MPDMLNHLMALHQVIIDTMFELLESKYPYASTPSIHSVTTILVLLYGLFLKANSMGPTGLRVQHLLDALDSRLPLSIEGLLYHEVNIVLAGNAPSTISCWQKPKSLLKSKPLDGMFDQLRFKKF